MQTVSSLLCSPKPPIWFGRLQTICWISCLAKVSKVVRNILPDGDQLTIQHLASFERPVHQKTNLTKLCKNLWKIFQPSILCNRSHKINRSMPCILDLSKKRGVLKYEEVRTFSHFITSKTITYQFSVWFINVYRSHKAIFYFRIYELILATARWRYR